MSSETVTTSATRPASSNSGDLVVSRMRSCRRRARHLLLEARQGLAGLEHLGVEHQMLGRVVLAVDLLQGAADRGRRVDAVELLVRAVDQGQAAAAQSTALMVAGTVSISRRRRSSLARSAASCCSLLDDQLAAQLVGALLEQLLLLAQGQEIARPGAELDDGRPGSAGSRWRPPRAPGSSSCGPRRP